MHEPGPSARTTTPDGALDEGELRRILGYQLAQATITTAQVFATHVGRTFELRPVEFTILALVCQNPGLSASRIAGALAVTPPNITMWIDRLESRGLVERERSTTDRRAQHILATPAGVTLARDAMRLLIEQERVMLAPLSPGEQAILIELLHKVACCREPAARP